MSLIRIYLMPKGYTDVVCEHVEVSSSTITVKGGKLDGQTYYPTRGAKVLKENVYEQLQLELDYGE